MHHMGGPECHMTSTDGRTRAQAAPAFSSSVTGVSLYRRENYHMHLYPTDFTFQPGHVSYRQ